MVVVYGFARPQGLSTDLEVLNEFSLWVCVVCTAQS